jgi:hypothetical protein
MQPRHHARLRTVALVGLAHWFFGNLYEEVVRMPARVAETPSRPAWVKQDERRSIAVAWSRVPMPRRQAPGSR